MADKELKRLLENLFSDIPVETVVEAAPPEDEIETAEIHEPAPPERPDLAAAPGQAPAADGELAEQMRRRTVQIQAASEIAHATTSILDLDELLPLAVDLIRDRFELYYSGIFLLDQEGQRAVLRAGTGPAGRQMVVEGHALEVGGDSMVGQCVTTGRAHIALDTEKEAIHFSNPLLPETRSEMALPLVSRGRIIGAMTIQSDQAAAFSQDDVVVLQSMADQLANAIENARLFEERERRIRDLAVVNEIGQALTSALQLDTLLEKVHLQISHIFDTTNFYIATYEEGSDEWASAFHLEGGQRQPLARYSIATGLTGHIIRSRQPLLLRSIEENVRLKREEGLEIIGDMARSWLGVPLIATGKLVGVMAIQNYESEYLYDEHDLSLFSTIAAQVASAIEATRLFEQTRRRLEELTAISRLSQTLAGAALQPEDIATATVRHFVEVMGVPEASVSLLDPKVGRMQVLVDFFRDPADAQVRRETTLEHFLLADYPATARVMETLQPLVVHVNDPDADPAELAYMKEHQVATMAVIPMISKGKSIGAIELESWGRERPYTPEEIELAMALASQTAVALENARLFEEAEARAEEQALLRRITETVSRSRDTQEVLGSTLETLLPAIGFDAGLFSLVDEATGGLHLVAERHIPPAMARKLRQDGLGGTLCDHVFRTGEALNLADVRQGAPVDVAAVVAQGLLTYAGVPLINLGERLGTICLFHRSVRRTDDRELALLQSIADQIAIGIANARMFERAQAALAEVQATHQSYLHRSWQEQLRQRELLREGGFLYDADQARQGQEVTLVPDLWRPEMARALQGRDPEHEREVNEKAPTGLAVPITLRGQTLGVIGVEAPSGDREWTAEDAALIEAISEQLAQTLESARLFEETQRTAQRERLIGEITTKIRASTDLHDIVKTAAEELGKALGTSRAAVRLHPALSGAAPGPDRTEPAEPPRRSDGHKEILSVSAREGQEVQDEN